MTAIFIPSVKHFSAFALSYLWFRRHHGKMALDEANRTIDSAYAFGGAKLYGAANLWEIRSRKLGKTTAPS
jgi:hypothetical protein